MNQDGSKRGENDAEKVVSLYGDEFTPKSNILDDLLSYWEDLRGYRDAPRRSEIDPRRIKPALNHTFILERTRFGGTRFRLAGTEVCDLMGMELRGMQITALFAQEARDELNLSLKDISRSGSVYEFMLETEQVGYRKVGAHMLLLPLCDDGDRITRIFGGIKLDRELLRPPVRFEIRQSIKNRVISEGEMPRSNPIEAALNEEAADFDPAPKGKPSLRLIVNNE